MRSYRVEILLPGGGVGVAAQRGLAAFFSDLRAAHRGDRRFAMAFSDLLGGHRSAGALRHVLSRGAVELAPKVAAGRRVDVVTLPMRAVVINPILFSIEQERWIGDDLQDL